MDGRFLRRVLEQRQGILRSGTLNNGDEGHISGLVAKSNSKSQCQQQRKSEHPEDNFGLALEFLHSHDYEVRKSRPAAIARHGRPSRRYRNFLSWAHDLSFTA